MVIFIFFQLVQSMKNFPKKEKSLGRFSYTISDQTEIWTLIRQIRPAAFHDFTYFFWTHAFFQ
jgi:hypothetical protein